MKKATIIQAMIDNKFPAILKITDLTSFVMAKDWEYVYVYRYSNYDKGFTFFDQVTKGQLSELEVVTEY